MNGIGQVSEGTVDKIKEELKAGCILLFTHCHSFVWFKLFAVNNENTKSWWVYIISSKYFHILRKKSLLSGNCNELWTLHDGFSDEVLTPKTSGCDYRWRQGFWTDDELKMRFLRWAFTQKSMAGILTRKRAGWGQHTGKACKAVSQCERCQKVSTPVTLGC